MSGATSSNEWYRLRLAGMGADAVKRMFTGTALGELRKLRWWGILPEDGLTVAIDIHLISSMIGRAARS